MRHTGYPRRKRLSARPTLQNPASLVAQRSGLTLIELLIVLLILSVASGLAGILIHRSGGLELKSLTKHIATTLRYARNRSVSEKKLYTFIVLEDKRGYGLYADLSVEADPEDAVAVVYDSIPDGLDVVVEDDMDDRRIDFYPLGNSNGGTVVITNDKGDAFFILINRLTGRIDIVRDEDV